MPICRPEAGPPTGTAEYRVWEWLRNSLPDNAYLLAQVRLADGPTSYEMDLIIAWPGVGICLFEVKGGYVRVDRQPWISNNGHENHDIDPYPQAAKSTQALIDPLSPAAKGYSA